MLRASWCAVTLILMIASFTAGRVAGGFHALPEIVATLPGIESDFSQEFDARIRERFPIGSPEEHLVSYLAAEGFAPEWRQRNEANASILVHAGLICEKSVRVFWRSDPAGLLTEVNGSYESQCR